MSNTGEIPNAGGTEHTVNGWSRFLGISLRPWSGEAPLSLILRGLIQLAISVFFLVLAARAPGVAAEIGGEGELGFLRGALFFASIALVIFGVIAALRIVVGVLDLIPRRSVSGTVVSLTDRKVGDFLPRLAQRAVFERRESGLDQRRSRVELVLQTAQGAKQWTVRSSRVRRELRVGAQVRLSVTPLTGYVARVDPLSA